MPNRFHHLLCCAILFILNNIENSLTSLMLYTSFSFPSKGKKKEEENCLFTSILINKYLINDNVDDLKHIHQSRICDFLLLFFFLKEEAKNF